LNLELDDFTNHLYKIIPHLGLSLALEDAPSTVMPNNARLLPFGQHSTSQLFFRALTLTLTPKHGRVPSHLLAAFGKRLLGLSLHVPSSTSVRTIDFVQNLLAVDGKLDAMLSTEEVHGGIDGVYRADIDDPRLCNPFGCVWWELASLEERHWDPEVRRAAARLRTSQAESGRLVP
jgi:nucleolar complex protein 3